MAPGRQLRTRRVSTEVELSNDMSSTPTDPSTPCTPASDAGIIYIC